MLLQMIWKRQEEDNKIKKEEVEIELASEQEKISRIFNKTRDGLCWKNSKKLGGEAYNQYQKTI